MIGIEPLSFASYDLAAVPWKTAGWKRTLAWTVIFAGMFFSAGNWLVKTVYPSGTTILCVVTAAVMLLGVLWCLYARDCFYAMTDFRNRIVILGSAATGWIISIGRPM